MIRRLIGMVRNSRGRKVPAIWLPEYSTLARLDNGRPIATVRVRIALVRDNLYCPFCVHWDNGTGLRGHNINTEEFQTAQQAFQYVHWRANREGYDVINQSFTSTYQLTT